MRAVTAAGPPAVRNTMSVALLSEIRSISSRRFRSDNITPGSSNSSVSVPLPGWRSAGVSAIRLSSRTSP